MTPTLSKTRILHLKSFFGKLLQQQRRLPALRQQLITSGDLPFKEIKPIYHEHKPHSDSAFCNRAIYCFDTEKQFKLLQIT